MLQYIYLVLCVITFVICGLLINLVQAILHVTLKYINRKLYYKVAYYLIYTYVALYVFFADWYSNSEIYLYMNKNDFKKCFGKETMYIISNHRTEVDWVFCTSLVDKANLLGNIKCYIRDTFKYIPGLGMTMYLADYIHLSRDYEKDKIMIEKVIKEYVQYPSSIAICITPEGTRYTKEKHELSMMYAKENGLPIMKYHLTPRSKGFALSLSSVMRSKLNAVYSITWAYDPEVPKIPDLLFGRKIKAYGYMKRIPIEEVPEDETEISKFMCNLFAEKDKLFDNFYRTGDFRTEIEKQTVERMYLPKKYSIWLNTVLWQTFSVGTLLFGLIYLLLNGSISILIICLAIFSLILLGGYKIVINTTMKTATSYGLNNNTFKEKMK